MSSARKLIFCEILSSYLKLLLPIAILFSFCHLTASETCVFKSPCECVYQNGSVINLNSLGSHTNARWKIKAVDNYTYYYNPCFAFSLGSSDSACAKGVAVCQVSSTGDYFDCGDQDHVHFSLDSATNLLHMIYTAPPRTTNVTLICSSEAYEPELEVKGEDPSNKNVYEMTLTSRCACPNLCRESHLSAGSVLVIIFFIFVFLYLFLGIIHSNLTRGAQGWELMPHYEFWSDFPLLVRDGCVFVVNGCKTDTGYDRI